MITLAKSISPSIHYLIELLKAHHLFSLLSNFIIFLYKKIKMEHEWTMSAQNASIRCELWIDSMYQHLQSVSYPSMACIKKHLMWVITWWHVSINSISVSYKWIACIHSFLVSESHFSLHVSSQQWCEFKHNKYVWATCLQILSSNKGVDRHAL
jgi:hypothetical protein